MNKCCTGNLHRFPCSCSCHTDVGSMLRMAERESQMDEPLFFGGAPGEIVEEEEEEEVMVDEDNPPPICPICHDRHPWCPYPPE